MLFGQEKRNPGLDGLRMWAITLIVTSHCGVLLQGGFGNAIFFCISGFLAVSPFSQNGETRFLSLRAVFNYYINRLIRILPVYYVCICSYWFLTGRFFSDAKQLLQNMLFIYNSYHLWFLQQEMVLYLVMPLILIILALVKKLFRFEYNDLLCALLAAGLAYCSWRWLTTDVFCLHANNTIQKFRLDQFMVGAVLGYLFKAYRKTGWDVGKFLPVKLLCNLIIISFLAFTVISSKEILVLYDPKYKDFAIGWLRPMLCTIATAVALGALLISPGCMMSRILGCRVFAYIGEISFVIYLVHMFVLDYFIVESELKKFIVVYFVSICIAHMLHRLVEKPSIIFAKTRNLKMVSYHYRTL